ncbi:hypothetical protein L1049_024424 [Liquidambar formosana]|uniref:Uncharacterized protein n=1 Tax=Liquidambar formosana TaxID=63359 RepID=A0AAP0X4Z2_LIQFO
MELGLGLKHTLYENPRNTHLICGNDRIRIKKKGSPNRMEWVCRPIAVGLQTYRRGFGWVYKLSSLSGGRGRDGDLFICITAESSPLVETHPPSAAVD